MQAFAELARTQPLVLLHLSTALGALLLGLYIMNRPKGTAPHRRLGWAWVILMGCATVSSAFLRGHTMPNIAGITPIHAFTLLVGIQLPYAIWSIRRGRVEAHRQAMRGIFIGGCVLAGAFTLLPGRFLGHLLWSDWLGLVA